MRSDGFSAQNKLNVHAPEFTVTRDAQSIMFSGNNNPFLQHSKSSGSIQQQMQLAAARRHAVQMANMAGPRVLVQNPMQLGLRVSVPQSSTSSNSSDVSEQINLCSIEIHQFIKFNFSIAKWSQSKICNGFAK